MQIQSYQEIALIILTVLGFILPGFQVILKQNVNSLNIIELCRIHIK
jgi:hypothetical protein